MSERRCMVYIVSEQVISLCTLGIHCDLFPRPAILHIRISLEYFSFQGLLLYSESPQPWIYVGKYRHACNLNLLLLPQFDNNFGKDIKNLLCVNYSILYQLLEIGNGHKPTSSARATLGNVLWIEACLKSLEDDLGWINLGSFHMLIQAGRNSLLSGKSNACPICNFAQYIQASNT